MKFYLVAFSTVFALFWDEAMIGLITFLTGTKVNPLFSIAWVIISGFLTSLLVSYHVPAEYRIVTIVLITFAVMFSINGYVKKEKYINSDNDSVENTIKYNIM